VAGIICQQVEWNRMTWQASSVRPYHRRSRRRQPCRPSMERRTLNLKPNLKPLSY